MLRYLNDGERDYSDPRRSLARRANWEFQAVVAGRCAAVEKLGQPLQYQRQMLWVFPPGHLHGWATEPGRPCRIVVAHFEQVPAPIREARRFTISLPASTARRVERTILDLRPDYETPTQFSTLRVERALLELSLVALSGVAEHRVDPATSKVTGALTWFAENMNQSPTVADVADAVCVSESHLRRLFARSGGDSPHRAMRRIQIDRASHLIDTTDMHLGDVADACGFASLSDFSRVYRQVTGTPPSSRRLIH